MIIPIIIDGQALVDQFTITKDQVESICDNIAKTLAAGYANQLEIEADGALHSTRRRYMQNVHIIDSGRMEGMVVLDYSKDKLIRMLEEGASPFDMKEYFVQSAKVKTGKGGGKYLTIPMRWGVPGTIGDSGLFTGTLPQAVYEVVKNKSATIPVSGGGMRTVGLATADIPKPFNTPLKRPDIKDSEGKILFKEYEHKTSLFQGLTRTTDPATGQNKYNSFRRVSENSDKEAFIYPGIEAYGLIQRALSNFDQKKIISVALDQGLVDLGF